MSVLAAPFHDLLAADAAVAAAIGQYRGAPAIFTQPNLPQDFDREAVDKPWVVSDGDSGADLANLDDTAAIILRDVEVLDVNDGAPSEVDVAAQAVWEAFRPPDDGAGVFLTVAGHRAQVISAARPVRSDPDEETFGRTITVRVFLEEQ